MPTILPEWVSFNDARRGETREGFEGKWRAKRAAKNERRGRAAETPQRLRGVAALVAKDGLERVIWLNGSRAATMAALEILMKSLGFIGFGFGKTVCIGFYLGRLFFRFGFRFVCRQLRHMIPIRLTFNPHT